MRHLFRTISLLLSLLLGANAGPIGLISLRPATVVEDPPSPPVDIGNAFMFLGDSQTGGYGSGSTINPPTAFRAIWDETQTPPSSQHVNGEGGRSLVQTNAYYTLRGDKGTRTMVYFQESGGQEEPGQETAGEFGDTFDDFIAEIISNTPTAVIVTETAFSFGREEEDWRDWTTYNTEQAARVATWGGLGTTIYVSQVNRNILRLQEILTPGEVWFQLGEGNDFHYKDAGNLMVALSMFDALGYDMDDLDLSGITVPTSTQINACLQVIAEFQ
jgi:hypothetical protein